MTGQLGLNDFPASFRGTSASAPHVAGIAALILDARPGLSPGSVADILATTAVDLSTTGYDNVSGYGRFDALAAVQKTLFPWHNFTFAEDVNNSGNVSTSDLIILVNHFLSAGQHELGTPTDWNTVPPGPYTFFLDVDSDNWFTLADLAIVQAFLVGAPVGIIAPVSPSPRNTPVSSVDLFFSEPVSGLNMSKLSLTKGGGNLLTGSQTLTQTGSVRWTLGNLEPITSVFGTYSLSVDTTGVTGGGDPVAPIDPSDWEMIPWQNVGLPLDIDNSGNVTVQDALVLINFLLSVGGTHILVPPTNFDTVPPPPYGYFYDISGDNMVRGSDVILLINYLLGAEPPDERLVLEAEVLGRHIFYNQSTFDGNTAGVSTSDDGAIATDKSAYLPGGGTAGPSSATSYSRGINGVMVDIADVTGTITADDFTLKVGTNNTPSTWATAPAPTTVSVRTGAGVSGSDRVEIIWQNNAIQNQWLQVIVEGADELGQFNLNTGLLVSDIFYFGNRVGDMFVGTPPTTLLTSAADEIGARDNPGFPAAITNIYDFDRNGVVGAADQTHCAEQRRVYVAHQHLESAGGTRAGAAECKRRRHDVGRGVRIGHPASHCNIALACHSRDYVRGRAGHRPILARHTACELGRAERRSSPTSGG
ncbi:MAG: dockerin type I domain-containing protein [Pirellulales bacterium]